MKLKAISIATLTALYTSGIYASVTPTWQPIELTKEQIEQRQKIQKEKKIQFDILNPKGHKTAVNRVIRKLNPEQKFSFEENLEGKHVYIIQLKDSPIATYQGGINNLPSTSLGKSRLASTSNVTAKVANKNKLFINSKAKDINIENYRQYLYEEQESFVTEARALGVNLNVRSQFTATLNAITAELTQQEAAKLAKSDKIIKIQRSVMHHLNTDIGPQVIKANQVWTGEGTHDGLPYKGEGQIVGIIDTGVNTDHVSFADIGDDGYDHVNPLGKGNYLGGCQSSEFADFCNDKLIGVYTWDIISDMYSADYFQPGYPDHNPWNKQQIRPVFGEDYHGHGSHVASTAAGNVIFDAPLQLSSYDTDPDSVGNSGDGRNTGLTLRVSGVAPHANIISYQACMAGNGNGLDPYVGCPTEATLASIEQAVLDGVDVINYSISGYGFPWENVIESAFYSAYAAGISVAAAAGNGGFQDPTNHNSPWLLNVAASHHGRDFGVEAKKIVDFIGGDTTPPVEIEGGSLSDGMTGYIISAEDAGDKSCDTPFSPGTFSSNQIVMCERSDQPRLAKAENIKAAGAGGFILYNRDAWGEFAGLVTDIYPLPSIHIEKDKGQEILDWLSTGEGHMATISSATAYSTVDESKQNVIASFTSAKQNPTFDGSLTPSIAAPGVQVFAAWADDQPFTHSATPADWNVIDGTSMASPHIAGSLALIRQAHPDWSVAEVQSAAQMTAFSAMDDGSGQDPYFRGGSGLINVAAAVNSGLVMHETPENMLLANPKNGGNPTTLNLPSLIDTSCEGTCSWARTVTATKDGTWYVEGMANHDEVSVDISVSPSSFTLKAGQSKTIIVTATILDAITQNSSPENSYLFGDVVFKASESDIPQAHWPVKLRFSRNDIPQILNVEAHRNNGQFTIKDMPVSNLVELNGKAFDAVLITPETITLPQDSDTAVPYYDSDLDGTYVEWIDVPENSKRLFAEELEVVSSTALKNYNRGDLDVYIGQDINNDGEINFKEETICWSYSQTELDYCSISDPLPGKYWVVYHNYKAAMDEEDIVDTYRVTTGVVTGHEASNITLSTDTIIDSNTHSVDVDIKWDINDWQEGDRIFSLIELGSSYDDDANIGRIPLNITRGKNDVTISASQTQVKPGDVISLNVEVLPNLTGNDREFEIQATLPEGASYIEGSAKVDNIQFTSSDIEIVDGKIVISGIQLGSKDWKREYKLTTNVMDQSWISHAVCH